MIYMKSDDGSFKLIVLETANLDELKKGRPARTPDGSVVIAWTPDPVWLSGQLGDTDGSMECIADLIEQAAKRQEIPPSRPYHPPYEQRFHKK